jgi:hypothetical protein
MKERNEKEQAEYEAQFDAHAAKCEQDAKEKRDQADWDTIRECDARVDRWNKGIFRKDDFR